MADDRMVELAKQGAQAWNAWRAAHPDAPVDLSGAGLRALDLTGADLAGADLTGADLRGASLARARLAGTNLRGANLFKAMLDEANMAGADLRGVQFLHCAQLQAARAWESARRDKELACGAAVPD